MPASSIIGVDLGGTKSAVARIDGKTFAILEKKLLPTRASRGFSEVFQDVVALMEELRKDDTVAAGIGIPGLIAQPEGVLVSAPNIPGSEGFPMKERLKEALDLPVRIANDAQCFALAEAQLGAGRAEKVVIGITMGTGVGGGIVIDGKLFQGANGFAGEIGHMLLIPGHPPFPTQDNRGEVEQFISGTAMGKRCAQAKRPEDYLEGEVCEFLNKDVIKEAAWMCVNLTYAFNPSMIIFGGSTGKALMPHLSKIEQEMSHWMLPSTPLPSLSVGVLEGAAMVGAALLTDTLSF
jgi:glucokinase